LVLKSLIGSAHAGVQDDGHDGAPSSCPLSLRPLS